MLKISIIFSSSAFHATHYTPYTAPFGTWAANSHITLLGDAAHIMPPSGEGVNLAMLDALELSEALTGNGTIADYEKKHAG